MSPLPPSDGTSRTARGLAALRAASPRNLGAAGLLALAVLSAGAVGTTLAQPAPPPPAARSTVAGSVAEVFGTFFVLQGPSGRVLVDLGPASGVSDLKVGEAVSVTGRQGQGPLRAEAFRRGDGPEVALRLPPPPPPGGPGGPGGPGRPRPEEARITPEAAADAVRAVGYTVTGAPERGPRHYDVPATNPRGEAVRIHVDLDGRPYKEVWVRPAGASRPGAAPTEAEALRMATEAGFTPTGAVTLRGRHAELAATRPDGRTVRLRVEADGVREADLGGSR